ncbi:MAG TPA: hypothetical protein VEA40_19180, partial [Ramlibacter sp.]|nr:hypothetical protein [Ramlibacter sp.]
MKNLAIGYRRAGPKEQPNAKDAEATQKTQKEPVCSPGVPFAFFADLSRLLRSCLLRDFRAPEAAEAGAAGAAGLPPFQGTGLTAATPG